MFGQQTRQYRSITGPWRLTTAVGAVRRDFLPRPFSQKSSVCDDPWRDARAWIMAPADTSQHEQNSNVFVLHSRRRRQQHVTLSPFLRCFWYFWSAIVSKAQHVTSTERKSPRKSPRRQFWPCRKEKVQTFLHVIGCFSYSLHIMAAMIKNIYIYIFLNLKTAVR